MTHSKPRYSPVAEQRSFYLSQHTATATCARDWNLACQLAEFFYEQNYAAVVLNHSALHSITDLHYRQRLHQHGADKLLFDYLFWVNNGHCQLARILPGLHHYLNIVHNEVVEQHEIIVRQLVTTQTFNLEFNPHTCACLKVAVIPKVRHIKQAISVSELNQFAEKAIEPNKTKLIKELIFKKISNKITIFIYNKLANLPFTEFISPMIWDPKQHLMKLPFSECRLALGDKLALAMQIGTYLGNADPNVDWHPDLKLDDLSVSIDPLAPQPYLPMLISYASPCTVGSRITDNCKLTLFKQVLKALNLFHQPLFVEQPTSTFSTHCANMKTIADMVAQLREFSQSPFTLLGQAIEDIPPGTYPPHLTAAAKNCVHVLSSHPATLSPIARKSMRKLCTIMQQAPDFAKFIWPLLPTYRQQEILNLTGSYQLAHFLRDSKNNASPLKNRLYQDAKWCHIIRTAMHYPVQKRMVAITKLCHTFVNILADDPATAPAMFIAMEAAHPVFSHCFTNHLVMTILAKTPDKTQVFAQLRPLMRAHPPICGSTVQALCRNLQRHPEHITAVLQPIRAEFGLPSAAFVDVMAAIHHFYSQSQTPLEHLRTANPAYPIPPDIAAYIEQLSIATQYLLRKENAHAA